MHGNRLKEIVTPIVEWYEEHGRDLPWRRDKDPYHVWVSEIMLQQTRIEAVIPYYRRFTKRLPNVEALAACPEEELRKLWEGLGYYSRVRNLQKAAIRICTDHGGEIPADYEAIRLLPGIGDYTAGAIASIAFDLPYPAVDGNVLRVLSRVHVWDTDIMDAKFRKRVTALLHEVYPKQKAGEFTQGLMELGEVICVPKGEPSCKDCPIYSVCTAGREGVWQEYPKRSPKAERKKESVEVFRITVNGRVILHQRPSTGLLANLWEYPNASGIKGVAKELTGQAAYEGNIRIGKAFRAKHIFTHIEWDMECYTIEMQDENEAMALARRIAGEERDTFRAVTEQEMAAEYTLPTAFSKLWKRGE